MKDPVSCSSHMAVQIKDLSGGGWEKKRITAFISFAFIYFFYTTGKLHQEYKT